MMCKAVISVLFVATLSWALPTGAPPSACGDMLPGHGVEPQPDPAPYHLMIATIEQGREYEFTIMGNSTSSHFKGFMIQAKDPAIHQPVGTFTTGSDAQTLDCFNGTANSATHEDATEKFMVTVNWVVPDTAIDEVHVVYTVAKEKDIFWTHQHHVLLL